jgi:spore coat polysaccharide biosynthesis protein SpsF (cytidylyltransferase family)
MLTLLRNKFAQIGAAIVALIVAVVVIFQTGKKQQKLLDEKEDLEDYKKIRERIDETPISVDLDDALDRLSKNNQLRD